MDAIVKNFPQALESNPELDRPSQKEAEDAVRVLLRWAGDDPQREGLLDTPTRVVKAYRELFAGYDMNPEDVLGRTFEEVSGYDDMVLVRDIPFFLALRTPYGADHWQGACRLSAEWPRSRPVEDCSCR